ncbi:MAG TPA: DUF3570 domain-containing protein [Gammaproteobacteria bacterium]|nr:DUF3570 domain-containing protein [Gammaproteobacteria bacterium]
MQLKDKPSIRLALAAASCALLTDVPDVVAENGDWDVDFGALYYQEKDRVSIVEPVALLTRRFNDEDFVSIRLVNDTMTGASPNGASVSGDAQQIPVQTSTSASGSTRRGSPVIVEPKTLPVNKFSDQRNAIALDWQKAYSRNFRTIIGSNFSVENDYKSMGGSVNFQRDTTDKLTTFTLGLSLSLDLVGGRNTSLQSLSVLTKTRARKSDDDDDGENEGREEKEDGENERNFFDGDRKWIGDILFGVTQVVSRRILTQLNYSVGKSSGYLTDPYKIISRIDAETGSTVDYLSEKRPDNRLRQAIYWKTVFHLPSDVVHITYRYYWDDWSVTAHTVALKYRLNLGRHFYLMPSFRYYKQSGANFFKYSLVNGRTLPSYASADLRLAPMQSITQGLKVGYNFSQDATVSFRVEYMQQWGEKNPSEAVGQQTQLTLFPRLEVMMYTFSLSMTF